MGQCHFCQKVENNSKKTIKNYPEITDDIRHETESFIAIPSMDHPQSGRFLIIPKSHANNFKNVFDTIHNIESELQDLIQMVVEKYYADNDEYFIFEHGASEINDDDHGAHLHIAPFTEAATYQEFSHYDDKLPTIESLGMTYALIPSGNSYALSGTLENGFTFKLLSTNIDQDNMNKAV